MGAAKYVNLAFLLAGFLLWATVSRIFKLIWDSIDVLRDYAILGQDFTLTQLLGLGTASVVTWVAWRNPKSNGFITEVVSELKKVTWPSMPDTKLSTWVVIVTTIICSLILGFFDFIWSWVTNKLYA